MSIRIGADQRVAVGLEKFPPAWAADRAAFCAAHVLAQIAFEVGQQMLPLVPALAGEPHELGIERAALAVANAHTEQRHRLDIGIEHENRLHLAAVKLAEELLDRPRRARRDLGKERRPEWETCVEIFLPCRDRDQLHSEIRGDDDDAVAAVAAGMIVSDCGTTGPARSDTIAIIGGWRGDQFAAVTARAATDPASRRRCHIGAAATATRAAVGAGIVARDVELTATRAAERTRAAHAANGELAPITRIARPIAGAAGNVDITTGSGATGAAAATGNTAAAGEGAEGGVAAGCAGVR